MGRLELVSTPLLCVMAVSVARFAPGVLARLPAELPASVALAVPLMLLGLASADNMVGNQFGVHRSGLPRLLLSPLPERDTVRGMALANALQLAISTLPALVLPLLVLGGGAPALWVCVWLCAVATGALTVAGGAVVSCLVPRAVDLGRLQTDNPWPGLAALVLLPAVATPPLAAAWLSERGGVPLAGLVFGATWLAASLLAARKLLDAAAWLLAHRRDAIAVAAEGR
jgi:hypothetical protein